MSHGYIPRNVIAGSYGTMDYFLLLQSNTTDSTLHKTKVDLASVSVVSVIKTAFSAEIVLVRDQRVSGQYTAQRVRSLLICFN